MKRLLTCLLLLLPSSLLALTLNVYGWPNYLPEKILRQFTQETGIHIQLTTYDSNEMLYAKLVTNPHSRYDIVMPTSYYVSKLAKKGLLRRLNHQHLTHLNNLMPRFRTMHYDPNNQMSIPYLWGSTGILVNDRYFNPKQFPSWASLWQASLKNQLLLLDDMRDVFDVALLALKAQPNSHDSKQIDRAYHKLKALMPNVKLFNSSTVTNLFIDEDVTIGMIWSDFAFAAMQENPHLHYIYPREGFMIWVDTLAIPRYAPHPRAAERFLNFILRADIAKQIVEITAGTTANSAAIKLLPKHWRNSRIINPTANTLQRGHMQRVINTQALRHYQQLWQRLKVGGSYE